MNTDITIILDRSGSMQLVAGDTIGGFNAFVAKQKTVEGKATLSLVQFDDQYEVVFPPKDIQDVPDLSFETFQPRGGTALYDAVGRTINDTGARLAALPENERPELVVMVIITDGHENASREFVSTTIADMIKHQTENYKWEFVFLGANQDAILAGRAIGVAASNSMSYANNSQGVKSAYSSVSNNLTSRRMGRVASMGFTAEDRGDQAAAGVPDTYTTTGDSSGS